MQVHFILFSDSVMSAWIEAANNHFMRADLVDESPER